LLLPYAPPGMVVDGFVHSIPLTYIGPCVVNRPVGDISLGAAVSVNTGSRRAACGTMSVWAVRRLRTQAIRRGPAVDGG
jgi:hypothetical protein